MTVSDGVGEAGAVEGEAGAVEEDGVAGEDGAVGDEEVGAAEVEVDAAVGVEVDGVAGADNGEEESSPAGVAEPEGGEDAGGKLPTKGIPPAGAPKKTSEGEIPPWAPVWINWLSGFSIGNWLSSNRTLLETMTS